MLKLTDANAFICPYGLFHCCTVVLLLAFRWAKILQHSFTSEPFQDRKCTLSATIHNKWHSVRETICSTEKRWDTVPSDNWRFATVHGVCSFPWLPRHVWRRTKQKHSRNMKIKLLLWYAVQLIVKAKLSCIIIKNNYKVLITIKQHICMKTRQC